MELDEMDENFDYGQFLIVDGNGKTKSINQNAVFEYIRDNNRLVVYGGVIWIYRNGVYKADVSGIEIKDKIRKLLIKEMRKINTINQIYGLFFADKSLVIEHFINYPRRWVCFKNGMFDPKTKKLIQHEPDFYAVNQIPWDYNPETDVRGDVTEKFLADSMESADVQTIWEILGLLCCPDNSFQKAVILSGGGGTGKSTMLNIATALIGKSNVSNLPLQNLEERFAAIQLLGKLANICGDLDRAALKTVATFKKIVGGDDLTDCYKGKDLVSFQPYARLIFSANEIPITLDEKSNAFFRRLIIIKMDNKPAVPDHNLESKLLVEMPYIIHKSMSALHDLYERGQITESDSSKQLVQDLYEESDSVKAFLNAKTVRMVGDGIKTSELYQAYKDFCADEEREGLSRNNFYRNIKGKGLVKKTVNGIEKFSDIRWNSEFKTPPKDHESGGFLAIEFEEDIPFA